MIRPAITPTPESPTFIPAAEYVARMTPIQTDVGRDYLATQAASMVTLPPPRRARCWHPWRAQHVHAGVTRWRCRGCCGCGEVAA